MKVIVLIGIVFFWHTAYSVKHSLMYFLTGSSGVQNYPEFVAVVLVDGVLVGFCDSKINTAEPALDWMKKCITGHIQFYNAKCLINQEYFRRNIGNLKQHLNQTDGVHILQRMNGCEWDDETGDIKGFVQYGYDGEDFLAFDLDTMTWTALNSQAVYIKQKWDSDEARLRFNKFYLTQQCPEWLKEYVECGKTFLQRTERPSVSLLQKTSSSPVTCHATGFYPGGGKMFWTKNGEVLQEPTEYGEILPNHDRTFQISADLDVSSVKPEEWERYDCVFRLPGVKDDTITKLDPAVIKTNEEKTSVGHIGLKIGLVLGLILLVSCTVAGVLWWKKKQGML